MTYATTTETINTVLSQDGTTLGYSTVGNGPAVIVIPGALSLASNYAVFAQELSKQFTVHTIERRGRGVSGPQGEAYSIEKECEDVLAVQQQTGASLLVGHSFGGLVALEVARRSQVIRKVAVYEPGVSINGSVPMDWMPRYEKKLAEKKPLDAFVAFALGTGPDAIRKTPPWLMKLMLPLFMHAHERKQTLSLLQENLREHREVARLDNSYNNYRALSAAVLLMYGEKGDMKEVGNKLVEIIPQASMREFAKLDHFGIDKGDPRQIAQVVSEYFVREG